MCDSVMQLRLKSCDLMKALCTIGAHQSADASIDWEMESASRHRQRPVSTTWGWLFASVVIVKHILCIYFVSKKITPSKAKVNHCRSSFLFYDLKIYAVYWVFILYYIFCFCVVILSLTVDAYHSFYSFVV